MHDPQHFLLCTLKEETGRSRSASPLCFGRLCFVFPFLGRPHDEVSKTTHGLSLPLLESPTKMSCTECWQGERSGPEGALRPRRESPHSIAAAKNSKANAAIAVGTAQSLANPQYPRLLRLRPVGGAPALPPARPLHGRILEMSLPRTPTLAPSWLPASLGCDTASAPPTQHFASPATWPRRRTCSARRGHGEHHSRRGTAATKSTPRQERAPGGDSDIRSREQ